MPQDCGLRLHLGGCDDALYCLHCPDLRVVGDDVEVDDVEVDVDSADKDIPNPNNMDSSSSNSTPNYNSMVYSNSRTDCSNHSTNCTKALQLRPTSQTSRLYILAQPKPYRPKP